MKFQTLPQVSVVMSVYNGADQLQATIDRVLEQEGVDIEFMIVDDGSEEETKNILKNYSQDLRVILFEQENQGLTEALIKGCAQCRNDYIARIDVGDLMLPSRLQQQAVVLNEQQDVVIVSSWVDMTTDDGEFLYQIKQESSKLTKALCSSVVDKVETPFHVLVMFRKLNYLEVGGYRTEFYFAQNLGLWLRLVMYGEVFVIEKVLTRGIFSSTGISEQYRQQQTELKRLSLQCRESSGGAKNILLQASQVKVVTEVSKKTREAKEVKSLYFLAKCLHDNKSTGQFKYWQNLFQIKPFNLKACWFWVKALVNIDLPRSNVGES